MLWTLLLLLLTHVIVSECSLQATEHDGLYTYCLHFSKIPYTWKGANELCSSEAGVLASDTQAHRFQDYDITGDVWVTNSNHDCLSLKEECEETSQSAFDIQCIKKTLMAVVVDCTSSKRFVVCSKETVSTDLPSTINNRLSSASITSIGTTVQTPPQPKPTQSTGFELAVTNDLPQLTQGPAVLTPKITTVKSDTNKESVNVSILTKFAIGLSMAKADLLGLIIGVVIGVFFIIGLIFVICCACHGKTSRRRNSHKNDLEFCEQNSDNSLINTVRSTSNDSSNTLDQPYKSAEEECSLDNIEEPLYCHKIGQRAHQRESYYPPPPNFNDFADTPVIQREQAPHLRHSVISDDLPLPPPPMPPRMVHYSDSDETTIKGLNPGFITHLDKTIAVPHRPMLYNSVRPRDKLNSQTLPNKDGPGNERVKLLCSDL